MAYVRRPCWRWTELGDDLLREDRGPLLVEVHAVLLVAPTGVLEGLFLGGFILADLVFAKVVDVVELPILVLLGVIEHLLERRVQTQVVVFQRLSIIRDHGGDHKGLIFLLQEVIFELLEIPQQSIDDLSRVVSVKSLQWIPF